MSLVIFDIGIVGPFGSFVPIGSRNPEKQGLVPLCTNDVDYFESKTETIFERSSVAVSAVIGQRRQEVCIARYALGDVHLRVGLQ